jgi:hypothetical protein
MYMTYWSLERKALRFSRNVAVRLPLDVALHLKIAGFCAVRISKFAYFYVRQCSKAKVSSLWLRDGTTSLCSAITAQ